MIKASVTIDGKEYIRVADVKDVARFHPECPGCVASTKSESRGKLCKKIFDAMQTDLDKDHFCDDSIWIRDTPQGKAKYIALLLEN